jgi:hypothetical protein
MCQRREAGSDATQKELKEYNRGFDTETFKSTDATQKELKVLIYGLGGKLGGGMQLRKN